MIAGYRQAFDFETNLKQGECKTVLGKNISCLDH